MCKRAIPNEHVLMRYLAMSLASSDALEIAFMKDFYSQEGLSIFLKDFSQYHCFYVEPHSDRWKSLHWSRKCIKSIVILQERFSLIFLVVLSVLWCQKSFSFLFSWSREVDELASRCLFQLNIFHESMIISAFLWRTTSMINMYEQKWVNFIWNVMLPKSIVRFLLPSRETKRLLFVVECDFFSAESIIECTGKHYHTIVTIVYHNSTLTCNDSHKHGLTYRSSVNTCSGSAPGHIAAKESYYICLYLFCYGCEAVLRARPDPSLAAHSRTPHSRVCLLCFHSRDLQGCPA